MKNKKIKIFKIYFFLSIFSVAIFFLVSWNINFFLKYYNLKKQNDIQKEKIEEAKKINQKIEKNLKSLETKEGVEKILIEQENLKKPGEKVIKILDY